MDLWQNFKISRLRQRYWSNTKFANWIRGEKKPAWLQMHEWKEWDDRVKAEHPIRWFLAEDLLDFIQNVVFFPYDLFRHVRGYLRCRFIYHSHQLTANPKDIKPGDWCDLTERILFCLFNELQNFVEVEKAGMSQRWRYGQKRGRSAAMGLEHLEWEMTLTLDEEGTPTPQAEAAREIYELYMWWTNVYRNRIDPYEFPAMKKLHEIYREHDDPIFLNNENPVERRFIDHAYEQLRITEEHYRREEEEMMIRLIKVRESLWT